MTHEQSNKLTSLNRVILTDISKKIRISISSASITSFLYTFLE